MTVDGYVPVNPETLETRFPGVYAFGDVATIGVPKAGVFAEGAARVVAASLIARLRGGDQPGAYDGLGSCYIEFGGGRVGQVDVDFSRGRSRRARSTSHPRPWSPRTPLRIEPSRALVRQLTPRTPPPEFCARARTRLGVTSCCPGVRIGAATSKLTPGNLGHLLHTDQLS